MKLGRGKKFIEDKYSQLLAIIIVLFIVAPALSGTTGQIVIASVLTITIITIIRTLNLKKKRILAAINFSRSLICL